MPRDSPRPWGIGLGVATVVGAFLGPVGLLVAVVLAPAAAGLLAASVPPPSDRLARRRAGLLGTPLPYLLAGLIGYGDESIGAGVVLLVLTVGLVVAIGAIARSAASQS